MSIKERHGRVNGAPQNYTHPNLRRYPFKGTVVRFLSPSFYHQLALFGPLFHEQFFFKFCSELVELFEFENRSALRPLRRTNFLPIPEGWHRPRIALLYLLTVASQSLERNGKLKKQMVWFCTKVIGLAYGPYRITKSCIIWRIAHNKILRYGPLHITKSCAMAHST
jgi:hypothetical protein